MGTVAYAILGHEQRLRWGQASYYLLCCNFSNDQHSKRYSIVKVGVHYDYSVLHSSRSSEEKIIPCELIEGVLLDGEAVSARRGSTPCFERDC